MKDICWFILVIVLIVLGSMLITKGMVRSACERFGNESGRSTKFVSYGYGWYDCLTPTYDNTWISTFNLRGL